jgi:hypothetical protein
MRIALATTALLATSTLLVGCGSDSSAPEGSGPQHTMPSVDPAALPASYRMVLHASCGERRLIGSFDLVVRDDRVVKAGPARVVSRAALRLSDFPTLADLVDKAEHAEPDAVVDLRLDENGVPRSLSIDHLPQAIDDEECYRVTGLRPLA